MSKKMFTESQVKKLLKNPYTKSVSQKGVTYSDEFKLKVVTEYEKGKQPRQIFEECGFDVNILGMKRVSSSSDRWRAAYHKEGESGLRDTRSVSSGIPRKKELSSQEKYERLEAQYRLLEAENELLKKIRFAERAEEKEISPSQKYILIRKIIQRYNLKRMVGYLCKAAGVSRSGYYRYFSSYSLDKRSEQEERDQVARDIIQKAFDFKNRKKGARQIKMTLEGQFNTVFNLKRIRRIMKKYGIVCPIRRSNPYKQMMKATQEHKVVPNLLNRAFKQDIPRKVLLTDITYLYYGKGLRAYLSTIKDGSTGEIVAYHVSERVTMNLATDTLKKLKKKRHVDLAEDALIHSDQGTHYTHPDLQKLVKKMNLRQSMSRRGNCWDNAPQESFFGHFKDEASIRSCKTLQELKKEIKSYMNYYNHYRYQWNLKKMTPVQYRDHLLKAA
ncbi:MAG: IS3 family transposase [Anaerobacillus sp.]